MLGYTLYSTSCPPWKSSLRLKWLVSSVRVKLLIGKKNGTIIISYIKSIFFLHKWFKNHSVFKVYGLSDEHEGFWVQGIKTHCYLC